MTMTIKVTQEHIDNGRRAVACGCPVALALKDATGRTWTVGCVRRLAPPEASSPCRSRFGISLWTSTFGNPVQPFDFDIPKPETV